MKIWYKLLLLTIVVLVVFIIFFQSTIILTVLKPFSEPCGYGGTSGREVQCVCDGSLFADVRDGSTNYYCTGSCSQCKCFSINFSDGSRKEEECNTFSQLSWTFPLS